MMGGAIVANAPGLVRGRRVVGSMADDAHIVACVNALHFAGITPEALAADPECVKKLVDVAQHVIAEIAIERVIVALKSDGDNDPIEVAGDDMICYGCGGDPSEHDPKCSRFVVEAALRACGIEVEP